MSDRAKSVVAIVAGALFLAIGFIQLIRHEAWFIQRGNGGFIALPLSDGWWILAVEFFFGACGVILGIAGVITDNWPPTWAG